MDASSILRDLKDLKSKLLATGNISASDTIGETISFIEHQSKSLDLVIDDSARLDYLIENHAFVALESNGVDSAVYSRDEDRGGLNRLNQNSIFADPRKAIDHARKAKDTASNSTLRKIILDIERSHFRTIHDTGSHDKALFIINVLRGYYDPSLPWLDKTDLAAPQNSIYSFPPDSNLLSQIEKRSTQTA